jgi:hypothetical protein
MMHSTYNVKVRCSGFNLIHAGLWQHPDGTKELSNTETEVLLAEAMPSL